MSTTEEKAPHGVHPGLAEMLTPVADLREHPNNPRLGNVDAIAESLDQNGQLKPIVARADGTIVAGNHTFKAAKKLGWTHVAALLLDLSDDQEKRYLLADNRVSDLAEYDVAVLQPLVREMADAGQLRGTGFSESDASDLDDIMNVDVGGTPDTAEHAESADKTAGRYKSASNEGGAPAVPMKEVTLMYPAEDFDTFAAHVTTLKKKWGIDATRDVVAEAVRLSAEAE